MTHQEGIPSVVPGLEPALSASTGRAMAPFEIAGGSVPGRAHVAAGRNSQDAFWWDSSGEGLVAVVCDGCGSGLHNEVGAKLGARFVVQAALSLLPSHLKMGDLLEQVRRDVLSRLRLLATGISAPAPSAAGSNRASFSRTVSDYFLFTVVGAIVADRHVTTFSIGDGLIVQNGDKHQLGPFPDNQPPYLGYALLPHGTTSENGERWAFRIAPPVAVDKVDSLLLGTDGAVDLDVMAERSIHGRTEPVGPLSQFWTDDRVFRNSDMVRRRLAVINRGPRPALPDDTTLVVMRRKGAGA